MNNTHMFSNKDLKKLLIPLIIEQLLNSFMGIADTIMVSNVGEAAVSAVSLVDSINILIIQLFTALSAGGAIVCSHYIGCMDTKKAKKSGEQLFFILTLISVIITLFCVFFMKDILNFTFGSVSKDVMHNSFIYFLLTAFSFPFIALYDGGASIFRSMENSRLPMLISLFGNIIHIILNAILIFIFDLGVIGAGLSTLFSRFLCAFLVMLYLRNENLQICIKNYARIRPYKLLIKRILSIGIPAGIENSMFQMGKLAIGSTISTLTTSSIAAQALTTTLENLNGIAGIGIGIGLMTIVGECMGAGRKDEAIYYIKKLTIIGEIAIIASCIFVFIIAKPVTILAGLSDESSNMCLFMITCITFVKPLVWALSFIPGYGLRAAGDVKFSMISSTLTMWFLRVFLCILLIRVFDFGPIAVWIGMFTDWTVRAILFTHRFFSKKWLTHKVV